MSLDVHGSQNVVAAKATSTQCEDNNLTSEPHGKIYQSEHGTGLIQLYVWSPTIRVQNIPARQMVCLEIINARDDDHLDIKLVSGGHSCAITETCLIPLKHAELLPSHLH